MLVGFSFSWQVTFWIDPNIKQLKLLFTLGTGDFVKSFVFNTYDDRTRLLSFLSLCPYWGHYPYKIHGPCLPRIWGLFQNDSPTLCLKCSFLFDLQVTLSQWVCTLNHPLPSPLRVMAYLNWLHIFLRFTFPVASLISLPSAIKQMTYCSASNQGSFLEPKAAWL